LKSQAMVEQHYSSLLPLQPNEAPLRDRVTRRRLA